MRTRFPSHNPLAFGILMLLVCGCASLSDPGMRADLASRTPPKVSLGREIALLDDPKPAHNAPFKSLIAADGRAHLFAADHKGAVHHLELGEEGVFTREILGGTGGDRAVPALDAVEHPPGGLRVLAGDRQFIRSAPGERWREVRGNLCSRFLKTGDRLHCAFIANGKTLGAPSRTDWTVGWFVLIPVVLWSEETADKLVIARESDEGWTIRAVLDPLSKLSARADFMAGTDHNGFIHLLYRSSGGSTVFFVGFGAGGGGALGGSASRMELRYARVAPGGLPPDARANALSAADHGTSRPAWSPIDGELLPLMPFVGRFEQSQANESIGPLNSHFTPNFVTGDLEGLLWPPNYDLDDGTRRIRSWERSWARIRLHGSRWTPHFVPLAANDLPEPGARWIHDSRAVIQGDAAGGSHALLISAKFGLWSDSHALHYLSGKGDQWSAPLVLTESPTRDGRRSLAVDPSGRAFAAWESGDGRIVGRWILPRR